MKPHPAWFNLVVLLSILAVILFIIAPSSKAAPTRVTDQYLKMLNDMITVKAKGMSLQQFADEQIRFYEDLLCSNGMEEYCPEPYMTEEPNNVVQLVVIRNVRSTFFNSTKAQTDDSPCEGAGGNICDAVARGENPIAISRDFYANPFRFGDKVRLTSLDANPECMVWNGKTVTVMDQLAECVLKNRDLRTNRCLPDKLITNQIDIFIPCEGDPNATDYCEQAIVKAKASGTCRFDLTLLK